ncbi:AAA family ATPase [Azonexus hydrophilus]|uniref:AAA family ATPase n=1 Tax=Azonexus hydrophilus TaxID=418702 RepID=UPI00197AB1ED
MKLQTIRLSNFQSFCETPTEVALEDITYLIGPNGSGKTAVNRPGNRGGHLI